MTNNKSSIRHAGDILGEAARTFSERRAVYGENWRMVGEVMKALFPEGVTLRTADDHNRFHIFMLKVVKLTRYTTNWKNNGHQDSIRDDTVYGAMLEAIDEEIEDRNRPKPFPDLAASSDYPPARSKLDPASIRRCKVCHSPTIKFTGQVADVKIYECINGHKWSEAC